MEKKIEIREVNNGFCNLFNSKFLERQEFEHDKEMMYNIELDNKERNQNLNLFTNSFVFRTSMRDCFRSLFSPDHIGQLRDNANAKYGISLECGQISFASLSLSEKSLVGIDLILDFNIDKNISSSNLENPVSSISLCKFFSFESSSNSLDGAYNLTFCENNISNFFVCMPLPLAIIAENNSFASVTNSIIYNTGNSSFNFLNIPSSISEANSFADLSVNLDFAINVSNNALCNALDLASCISNPFAMMSSLTNLDNSLYDSPISSLSSDGISTLITISVMPKKSIYDYINFSQGKGLGELAVSQKHRVYVGIASSNLSINSCTILANANSNSLLNSGAISILKQNVSDKENKKGFKDVTLMVRDFFLDYDNYSNNKHINLSASINFTEDGKVTLVVRDRPDESDLLPRRRPGSIPGRTASAISENNNGKMYGIESESEDYDQDDSLESDSFSDSIFSFICFVDIPKPISNNNFSYVHSLIPLDKQSAIKSSSFVCLFNSCLAFGMNAMYSSNGTKVILLNNSMENLLKLSSESFDFNNISSSCLINSSSSINGANVLNLRLNNNFRISPLEINVLNRILESITTSIYNHPFFLRDLCIDNLILSDNSSAFPSVNSLFEMISSAIASSNLSINSCTILANANSNSLLNSGAISILKQISTILNENKMNYINVSVLLASTEHTVYAKVVGKENFGLIPVKDVYLDIDNCVCYMTFCTQFSNEKLQKGGNLNNAVFHIEKDKEIRVKNTEEYYNEKIYDVDLNDNLIEVEDEA